MSRLLEGLIKLVESQGYQVIKKPPEYGSTNNEPEINGMAEPPPKQPNRFLDRAKLSRMMQGNK